MKLACCFGYTLSRYGRPPSTESALRALAEMAELGVSRAEIAALGHGHVRSVAGAKERFRFAADRLDLELFSCWVSLEGLFSRDEAVREQAFEDYDLAGATGEYLGAQFVQIASEVSWERNWASVADTVKAAALIAGRYGLTLLIEPPAEEGAWGRSWEALVRLLGEVGEANVKAVLDTADLHSRGEDLGDCVVALGEGLGYVRAADSDGRAGVHLPPGAGAIDWAATLGALVQHRYTGYLGLQILSQDAAQIEPMYREGIDHLRGVAERGGFQLD